MNRKITAMALGSIIAAAAGGALADTSYTTYYATESGTVSDNDGRVYSYVIYGTEAPSTPVVATAADVNAVGRIPFTAATVPARPVDESVYDGATVAPESNVSAKAPDVNEVLGRA